MMLRAASALLTLVALWLLGASLAASGGNPGAFTPIGRRLYAGTIAAACVALLLGVIAAIPLRRGEKWAFWAYAGVLALLALPIAVMETLYAPHHALLRTLAPQVLGLAAAAAGLAMCAQEIWKK